MTLDALSNLLEAIDCFLCEAGSVQKKRIIASAEKKIRVFMAKMFSKQGSIFLKEHGKYESDYPVEEAAKDYLDSMMAILSLATSNEIKNGMVNLLGPILNASSGALFQRMNVGDDFVEIAFDLKNPIAVKWLEDHAAEMVTQINETTRNEMRQILSKAADEGWSYGKTSKEIRDRFEGFAGKMPQAHIRNRAEGIAVTESRMAYEKANLETGRSLKEAGLDMIKSWYAHGGCCEICDANEADGWIGIDELFMSGDDAPPAHPYCRCDLLIQRRGAGEE